MKKKILSVLIVLALVLVLGISLMAAPVIPAAVADSATPSSFNGWYCVNYDGVFHVSTLPISTDKAAAANILDVFQLRTLVDGEYTEAGIALYVDGSMTLGELSTLGIVGSGSDYAVNLWLDVGGDNQFFAFDETGNMTGLAGDYYGQINSDANGLFTANGASTVKLQYGHGTYTLEQLKANACPGVTSSTKIAFWIGVYENHPMSTDIKSIYVNGPPEVWVDDDWSGSILGDPAGEHTFGLDAFATIQNGIDDVAIGGTVNVNPGIYVTSLNIEVPKSGLTLEAISDKPAETTIQGLITIRADNVTMEGFMLDLMGRELNIEKEVRPAGTDDPLSRISGVKIKNNVITHGYILPRRADNLDIIGNHLVNPGPNGIAAYGSFSNVKITGNTFSGGSATWEMIYFTENNLELSPPASLTDFEISGNTLLMPNNRPHFVDQPGDLDIANILVHNNFDRAVVINSGASLPHVIYSSIQAVIDGQSISGLGSNPAQPGDTINVASGTYDEQIVIDKCLTLEGAGDTTIVQPSSADILTQHFTIPWAGGTNEVAGIIVADGTANVTVKNLKADGDNITTCPSGASWVAGILYRESGGTIDNVDVTNLTIGDTGTAVRGQAILLSAVDDAGNVEVMHSRVFNYDKNGITAIGNKLTPNIHDNEVVGRGPLPEGDEVQNGIMIIQDAIGTVNDNAVSNHAYIPGTWGATGILFCNASGSAKGNTSVDNQMGIVAQILTHDWGDFGSYIQEVSFEGNRVDAFGLDVPVISGVNAATYADDASLNVTIISNDLTGGAGNGISIGDTEDLGAAGNVTATIDKNSIYGWDTDINNLTDNPVDATNNWWGNNKGPIAVSGNVGYDPWLVIGISANPASIEANGTSTATVTADMTKNSEGKDTSDSGHISDGTQITFSTSKGSIIGTKTFNGVATATLTSSATVATATVKASAPPYTSAATATTTIFFTKAGVEVTGSKTEETTSGNVTVDAKTEASTEVEKKGDGTPTITVAKYDKNPGSGFSGDTGTYIDVHADNVTDVDEIVVKVYYTNAEISGLVESSLKLRWWDGTVWTDCSDSGVDTKDIAGPPAYSGYMWAKIRSDTKPSLSNLGGTVFGGKGETPPATTQGPSGGGGGGGMPPLTTNLFGQTTETRINYLGIVQNEIKAVSEDGRLTVVIPKGTKALNKNNDPLYSLTAISNNSPPDPPKSTNIIGLAYDFGPDGANFQPAITFTWSYDLAALPQNVSENSLVIVYFDNAAGKWVELDGKVDKTNHTITASVTHFTTFAMLGTVAPVTTPPATTPATPTKPPATIPTTTTPSATTTPATTTPATTSPTTTPSVSTTPVTTPPVSALPEEPEKPMPTYWWWIIGIAVVIVIGVTVLIVRRRRG